MKVPGLPFNRDSHDWVEVKAWLLGKIAEDQLQLERFDLTPDEHNIIRGQIRAYRSMIEAVEPVVVPDAEERRYDR